MELKELQSSYTLLHSLARMVRNPKAASYVCTCTHGPAQRGLEGLADLHALGARHEQVQHARSGLRVVLLRRENLRVRVI